jgi:hypothetical protein
MRNAGESWLVDWVFGRMVSMSFLKCVERRGYFLLVGEWKTGSQLG